MKTTKQIKKQRDKVSTELRELEEKMTEIAIEKRHICDAFFERKEIDRETMTNRLAELTFDNKVTNNSVEDLQVMSKILMHNYRIALFTETIPVILEVFSKYNGKPYGEKTREKIRLEIKERTGCHVYLESGYRETSTIVISDGSMTYGTSIRAYIRTADDEKRFDMLPDNKIDTPEREQVHMYYNNYIDNPSTYINKMHKAYDKAFKAAEEARVAVEEYNKILPFGMDRKNVENIRYGSIFPY